MTARQLSRRLDTLGPRVADLGARRADPTFSDAAFDLLTADECAAAAAVRERLDAVSLSGIPDVDLDFCICLNERLSGQRADPCVLGAR